MMAGFVLIISCWIVAIVIGDFLLSLRWLLAKRQRRLHPILIYGRFVWNLVQVLVITAISVVFCRIYIK